MQYSLTSFLLLAASTASAQYTTVIISDGVYSTLTLPEFPETTTTYTATTTSGVETTTYTPISTYNTYTPGSSYSAYTPYSSYNGSATSGYPYSSKSNATCKSPIRCIDRNAGKGP